MEKSKKVYIVMGSAGRYDDYINWIVRLFFDKEKAEEFKNKCQTEADKISNEVKKIRLDIMNIGWKVDKKTILLQEKINKLMDSHKYDLDHAHNIEDWVYEIEEAEVE